MRALCCTAAHDDDKRRSHSRGAGSSSTEAPFGPSQHPDLAAEQLEHAVKQLGLRGPLIGGSVSNATEASLTNRSE